MSDQVILYAAMGKAIQSRANELGMSMQQVRAAMREHGGPVDNGVIYRLYAGEGTVRHKTKDALTAALQTNWLHLETTANDLVETRIQAQAEEDAPVAEAALAHRVQQLDLFGGDDLPSPAPKRKGLSYLFPEQVHVFHHFDFGETAKRKLSTLRRVLLRRAL